jgi:hypothetical protein
VKVFPATVRVPVREDLVELDDTEYRTVPLPVPLAPAVMVIQETLLTAVQEQPPPAATVIDPFPPLEPMDLLAGEIA